MLRKMREGVDGSIPLSAEHYISLSDLRRVSVVIE